MLKEMMKGSGRGEEQGEWGSVAPIPASSSKKLMAMEKLKIQRMKSITDAGVEKTSYEGKGDARQDKRIQVKMNEVRWKERQHMSYCLVAWACQVR
jgi:hypothetical protein